MVVSYVATVDLFIGLGGRMDFRLCSRGRRHLGFFSRILPLAEFLLSHALQHFERVRRLLELLAPAFWEKNERVQKNGRQLENSTGRVEHQCSDVSGGQLCTAHNNRDENGEGSDLLERRISLIHLDRARSTTMILVVRRITEDE